MCTKLLVIEKYLDFKLEHKLGVFEVGRSICHERPANMESFAFLFNVRNIPFREIKHNSRAMGIISELDCFFCFFGGWDILGEKFVCFKILFRLFEAVWETFVRWIAAFPWGSLRKTVIIFMEFSIGGVSMENNICFFHILFQIKYASLAKF